MTLEDIAAELYGAHPETFVASRAEGVAAARASNDQPLARSIAALRKPTVGAWLANLLAREETEQVQQLVELGGALREAQDLLDPDELRTLGRQRHQVVASLVTWARRRAAELGHPASQAAAQELEDTLSAAMVDPAAGAQLLQGRLTHGLSYAGFGEVSSPAATGSSRPRTAASSQTPATSKARGKQSAADEAKARAAREAAAQAAKVDAAERELAAARLQAAEAAETRAAAEQALAAITADLEAAQERVEQLRQAQSQARAAHTRSTTAATASERAAERAAAAVDRLRAAR